MTNEELFENFEGFLKQQHPKSSFRIYKHVLNKLRKHVSENNLKDVDLTQENLGTFMASEFIKKSSPSIGRAATSIIKRLVQFKADGGELMSRNNNTPSGKKDGNDAITGVINNIARDVSSKTSPGGNGTSRDDDGQDISLNSFDSGEPDAPSVLDPDVTIAPISVSTFRGKKIPKVPKSEQFRKILPDRPSIRIYGRNRVTGKLQHIGDYTAKEIMTCGDFDSFMKSWIVNNHDFEDFDVTKFDKDGNETPHGSVHYPKPKASSDSSVNLREAIKIAEEQRKKAEDEMTSRSTEREALYHKALDVVNKIKGEAGSGNLARDMIMMQMAGDMMKDLKVASRTEDPGVLATLGNLLEGIEKKIDSQKQSGGSFISEIMNMQLTMQAARDMMRSLREDEDDDVKPSRNFDIPIIPPEPKRSPAEEFSTIAKSLEPLFKKDENALSTRDIIEMMNSNNQKVYEIQNAMMSAMGSFADKITTAIVQNQQRGPDPSTEIILRRLEAIEQKGGEKKGLLELSQDLEGIMKIAGMIGLGPGGEPRGMFGEIMANGPEFLTALSKVINSMKGAAVKQIGSGEDEEGDDEEGEGEEENPVVIEFAKRLDTAVRENDDIKVLKSFEWFMKETKGDERFGPIMTGMLDLNQRQLSEYLVEMINVFYQGGQPPVKNMNERIASVVFSNRDRLGQIIGVKPKPIERKVVEKQPEKQPEKRPEGHREREREAEPEPNPEPNKEPSSTHTVQ